jgi:hypothetical protein
MPPWAIVRQGCFTLPIASRFETGEGERYFNLPGAIISPIQMRWQMRVRKPLAPLDLARRAALGTF